MTLAVALIFAYHVLATVLIALMALKRVFRYAPVFFAYTCFGIAASIAGMAIYRYDGSSGWHWRFFLFDLVVDCLLHFWVLAELGKNLLRFNGKSRPYWKLAVLLFAAASVLVSVLSRWTAAPGRSLLANLCFQEMRVDGALAFAGFLALISWSHLRKLRWPERELRIATGFGFVTFSWFLVSLLVYQWNTGPAYYWIYEAGQVANLVTVVYWLHYFWVVDRGLPARSADAEPESRSGRDDREPTRCLDHASSGHPPSGQSQEQNASG